MARREFSTAVKREIKNRATSAGVICCEGCGLVLDKKPYEIDHTTAEVFVIDKSKPLTAADGKLLGKACCHDPKTFGSDIPNAARAKRREAKHDGFAKKPAGKLRGPGFPQSDKAAKRSEKLPVPPRRAIFQTKQEPRP